MTGNQNCCPVTKRVSSDARGQQQSCRTVVGRVRSGEASSGAPVGIARRLASPPAPPTERRNTSVIPLAFSPSPNRTELDSIPTTNALSTLENTSIAPANIGQQQANVAPTT